MIYVASPYSSGGSPEQRAAAHEERYREAKRFVTYVIVEHGPAPFSPIVYCHPLAVESNLPGDAEYWYKFNMQFLRKSEAVFVLMLDGWEKSKGVKAELDMAQRLRIPVYYYKWNEAERVYEEVTLQ